jgi:hypothetical protein
VTSKQHPTTFDADDHADAGPSLTVGEFCDAENISSATYVRLRRRGLGPAELRVPSTKIIRITARARAAWHHRMAELQNGRAAKLEAARRRDQTVAAARSSVASRRAKAARSDRPSRRRHGDHDDQAARR